MSIEKIVAIDPGLTNTGWSYLEYDTSTGIVLVKHTGKICAIAHTKKVEKESYKKYGNLISLMEYEKLINELQNKYHPDHICCEDAFYNSRTPNAYLSLKLCINSIGRVLYSYDKLLYLIAPKVAKQAVFGKGTANKEDIQLAIRKIDNLHFHPDIVLDELVEHEADSIAIGYAFIMNNLHNHVAHN